MRPNPQETADLVTYTEEILNAKLHFLCSDSISRILVIQNLNWKSKRLPDTHMKCTKRKHNENHKYEWKYDFFGVVIKIYNLIYSQDYSL